MPDIRGGATGTNKRIPDACDVRAAAFVAGALSGFSSHRAFNREHFSTVFTAVIVLSHVFIAFFNSRDQSNVSEPVQAMFSPPERLFLEMTKYLFLEMTKCLWSEQQYLMFPLPA